MYAQCIENKYNNTNFTLNQYYEILESTNYLSIKNDWIGVIDLKTKNIQNEFEVGLCKFKLEEVKIEKVQENYCIIKRDYAAKLAQRLYKFRVNNNWNVGKFIEIKDNIISFDCSKLYESNILKYVIDEITFIEEK